MLQSCDEETDEKVKQEELENQITELENSCENLQRRIRMIDSEKHIDVEASNVEIKKNDSEIKQLRMEIKELEVKIKRSKMADENVILKEFRKCSMPLGQFKEKSAKEAINLLDSQILELDKKCKAFGHELELLKRAYTNNEKQFNEMATKCDEDFENEPTEYDSMQRIRELENEQQKLNKDILDGEVAYSRYKTIKEELKANQKVFPLLVQDVEKEYIAQEEDLSHLNPESKELEPNMIPNTGTESPTKPHISSEAGDGKKTFNPREKETKKENVLVRNPITQEEFEQQRELKEIQEVFEQIKAVTCVTDIQSIEKRFITQKSIQEDLSDLKKRLMKSLQELRAQKKQLNSKMVLIRGSNSMPKSEMTDDIYMAKNRFAEQEERKNNAEVELEKLSLLLEDIDKRQNKILNILEYQFPEEVPSLDNENMTLVDKIMKAEEKLYNNIK